MTVDELLCEIEQRAYARYCDAGSLDDASEIHASDVERAIAPFVQEAYERGYERAVRWHEINERMFQLAVLRAEAEME